MEPPAESEIKHCVAEHEVRLHDIGHELRELRGMVTRLVHRVSELESINMVARPPLPIPGAGVPFGSLPMDPPVFPSAKIQSSLPEPRPKVIDMFESGKIKRPGDDCVWYALGGVSIEEVD
jgi:hypothetical protein